VGSRDSKSAFVQEGFRAHEAVFQRVSDGNMVKEAVVRVQEGLAFVADVPARVEDPVARSFCRGCVRS
jgi:hypothetical protein